MKIIFIFFILLFGIDGIAQSLNQPQKVVDNFYEWYFKNGYKNLSPKYRIDSFGMTKLDFSLYDKLLSKYGFTKKFIKKSKERYSECANNLSEIPFNDFRKFDDIDQYENIDCSFQGHLWFNNSMEPMKYYKVISSKKVSNSNWKINVELAYQEEDVARYSVIVMVEFQNAVWKIKDIDW